MNNDNQTITVEVDRFGRFSKAERKILREALVRLYGALPEGYTNQVRLVDKLITEIESE